ncbi:MAG: DUF1194 domain-containing protein [Paracoccaceae bacterium]|nr:DUF1194 domain-containing protein [Paracoccaceae bacterium]
MRALVLAILLALPARAEAPVEVDLELVLAVDVSRSMSPGELEIQRQGYAAALTSPEVIGAIRSGFLGRIGLTYLEWAGSHAQRVTADWTLIETPEDAAAFAYRISRSFSPGMRRTSISGALLFARERLLESPFDAPRQVVDVSGDGPNNHGRPVLAARDILVSEGVTINGLPLMTNEGAGSAWHLPDLDLYYQACVIGGPGAFVVPVYDWSQFASAVRRKLVLEISGLAAAGLRQAQAAATPAAYDCLIGERIWERNRQWDFP